jgi:hypothetical protein
MRERARTTRACEQGASWCGSPCAEKRARGHRAPSRAPLRSACSPPRASARGQVGCSSATQPRLGSRALLGGAASRFQKTRQQLQQHTSDGGYRGTTIKPTLTKAVVRVVCKVDCLLKVLERRDGDNGTKHFFTPQSVAWVDVRKDGGGHKVPVRPSLMSLSSAAQQRVALHLGLANVRLNLSHLHAGDHRPHVGVLSALKGASHPKLLGRFLQASHRRSEHRSHKRCTHN